MAKYLNPNLVCSSFRRLSSRSNTGKTHLERTSALMYFLAIDATFKYFDVSILDLNPDSQNGKNNRKHVELEFSKLVLVENSHGDIKQVMRLGKISVGGTPPEKRISSNFFTVPLKKASEQKEAFYYPNRPAAPLLKLGAAATGKKWGVEHHSDWESNLPILLSEIRESTPFLDLAIFACRDCRFENKAIDAQFEICDQLKQKFTKKLSAYWALRIGKEKILTRKINEPFIDKYSLFASIYEDDAEPVEKYKKMTKDELIDRIIVLEQALNKKHSH